MEDLTDPVTGETAHTTKKQWRELSVHSLRCSSDMIRRAKGHDGLSRVELGGWMDGREVER